MRALLFGFAFFAALSCGERVELGSNLPGSAGSAGAAGAPENGGTGGGNSGGQAGSNAGASACEPTECLGKMYACGDCIDNDGDGFVDSVDPECLGPCDDTEDSYFGGNFGEGSASCRLDCYFDRDRGSGNDGCVWSHACDALSIAPGFPPSGDPTCAYDPSIAFAGQTCGADQSEVCRGACLPLTPNGCDCFGCCELPARSNRFVWIGSETAGAGTCDGAHLDDPSACRPCTPVPSCFNACEGCEVCVGGSSPAPGCGAGTPSCEPGVPPCGALAPCDAGAYCITGCCIPVPR